MGDFEFTDVPAAIGQNGGNCFTVTLRKIASSNPGESEDTIRSRLERLVRSVGDVGFLNYYGLQRFGNSAQNIAIGVHILHGAWKEAVLGILQSSGNKSAQQALEILETTGSGAEAAAVRVGRPLNRSGCRAS